MMRSASPSKVVTTPPSSTPARSVSSRSSTTRSGSFGTTSTGARPLLAAARNSCTTSPSLPLRAAPTISRSATRRGSGLGLRRRRRLRLRRDELVHLGQAIAVGVVDLDERRPLVRDGVLREDRLDRALGLAGPAVDALLGVDDEHPVGLVDAVDGADVDAGLVLHIDAGFGDDVRHLGVAPELEGS